MHDRADSLGIEMPLPVRRIVALSVVLWATGVACLHAGAPYGLFGGAAAVPLLVATVPLVWLTLRLVLRVAGAGADIVLATAWVCLPAALLDGAAFSVAPWLYGADEAARRAGAGWLLWFLGVSLALAFWRGSRQAGRPARRAAARAGVSDAPLSPAET